MQLKKIVQKILPLGKYGVFLYIALYGFPYLYIDAFRCYVSKLYAILAFFLLSVVLDHLVSGNRYLKESGWGKSVASVLIVELFCLSLFAQYHFYLAILLLLLLSAFAAWCYKTLFMSRRESRRTPKFRRACRRKVTAILCCLSAAVLLVPAGFGVYQEHKQTVSTRAWQVFVQKFSASAKKGKDLSVFEKHPDTLEDLKKWDQLSRDNRLAVLSKIGLMEEEYLGIETEIPIVISSEKMEVSTCAYYEDTEKKIRINLYHIDNDGLEDNLTTILHEVFHAYQYYVVDRLDFGSSDVKNGYYYADARAWHDNMDQYISGYLDYDAYQKQPLEADARAYAEQRAQVYLTYIGA